VPPGITRVLQQHAQECATVEVAVAELPPELTQIHSNYAMKPACDDVETNSLLGL
jgi:hypothetical protein